jgi:hypothetical protein
VHDHIVRLGVNYKLGDPVYIAPAPARGVYKAPVAAVAYTWSGLYIGGNVGLSVARNPTTAPSPILWGQVRCKTAKST